MMACMSAVNAAMSSLLIQQMVEGSLMRTSVSKPPASVTNSSSVSRVLVVRVVSGSAWLRWRIW